MKYECRRQHHKLKRPSILALIHRNSHSALKKKTKKYENEVDDRPSESNKKNFQENKLNKMNSIQK